MKKLLLLALCFSANAFASPQSELTERLNKYDGFSAQFEQKVTSPEGEVIVEGDGDVAISRPNLFRWYTKTPDENVLVTDGTTLWYYNPFVEQVTLLQLDQATAQTPFVLLTRNNPKDWDNYTVTQQENQFTLSPKQQENTSQFIIDITSSGVVKGFSVIGQDGQSSVFAFNQFVAKKPDSKTFMFTIPEGVDVDDQRN